MLDHKVYKRFTPSGFKDMWMRKFEFAAKTHFLGLKGSRLEFTQISSDTVKKQFVVNPEKYYL